MDDSSAELAETRLAKNLAKFRTLRLEHPSRKERARGTACELVNRISLLDMVKQLGDRLTVGQRTLTPPVLVRIQVPQPIDWIALSSVSTEYSKA